jgi:Uma2 family endonuclease
MSGDRSSTVGTATRREQNGSTRFLPHPPPLESGDHLTRAEFERRYEAMPWVKKAELIEGVVYVASPVRNRVHAQPHARLVTWAGLYSATTAHVYIADNGTLRLDPDNEPQPDIMLLVDPRAGGASWSSVEDYVEGAPELVIEVAASSVSYDLREKKRVYWRNGVREYLVWQVYDGRVDWWELRDGEYQPLAPDERGVLKSGVFPGLWLDVPALLDDTMARVLATLQQGLATPEHAAFVAELSAAYQAGDPPVEDRR